MFVPRPKKLQTKFMLGLMAVALCGGLLFSAGLYVHLRGLLESEVVTKAELILDQVEAVRLYVRETLRPTMYANLEPDEFIIEAMSTSYITRRVMERMVPEDGSLIYRRVAINARNPNFEADERERDFIDYFRNNPSKIRLVRFEEVGGQEFYTTARPVTFTESCTHCHGVPEDAPPVLLERYGSERGFARPLNEVGGVTFISLPVASALTRIRGATLGYAIMAVVGTLLCFGIINVLFTRIVVHNLKNVTDIFPRYFPDETVTALVGRLDAGDEIESVQHAVEELANHLSKARKELENYAVNLKQMVDDRTADLSLEARERRTDVNLFVRLLDGLNTSQTRRQLIENALPQIGQRFGAREAAFVCTVASQNSFSWPTEGVYPPLPDDWADLLTTAVPRFTHDSALIPVQASETALEGYLCLYWDEDAETEPGQVRDVLTAMGRQLGIAMENLNAVDNLLQQNMVLDSIFEGIADTLLLMDGNCEVILANKAAQAIAPKEEAGDNAGPLSLARLLGLDPERGAQCPLRIVVEKGEPVTYDTEIEDGRTFTVSIYPLPGDTAPHGRAVVYARETTAEKRMLAHMQQNEKLVTVGKLAAGLAHEINNPLGVILCYAELLRTASAEPQGQDDVDVIIRHTKQAQKILQDLLNFARPRKADAGPCDPLATLRMLADVFTVQAESKGVAFTLDVPDQLPQVPTDTVSLEQILTNLFINALDAVAPLGPQGAITLRAGYDAAADEVHILTQDNGPGIPPEQIPHIFDPFFSTKDVGKGTGLGLAVVYGLVQESGGRIEARSNAGAHFTLAFPAAHEPQAQGDSADANA